MSIDSKQFSIIKKKLNFGCITQCHFWKQNPDQIPNFQKINQKNWIRLVGKGSWKEREVGKF